MLVRYSPVGAFQPEQEYRWGLAVDRLLFCNVGEAAWDDSDLVDEASVARRAAEWAGGKCT